MQAALSVTEHVIKTARHTTFYLACGADDALAIIAVHRLHAMLDQLVVRPAV